LTASGWHGHRRARKWVEGDEGRVPERSSGEEGSVGGDGDGDDAGSGVEGTDNKLVATLLDDDEDKAAPDAAGTASAAWDDRDIEDGLRLPPTATCRITGPGHTLDAMRLRTWIDSEKE
jgi:hypothetical protein